VNRARRARPVRRERRATVVHRDYGGLRERREIMDHRVRKGRQVHPGSKASRVKRVLVERRAIKAIPATKDRGESKDHPGRRVPGASRDRKAIRATKATKVTRAHQAKKGKRC
jgi:hypothetical protein